MARVDPTGANRTVPSSRKAAFLHEHTGVTRGHRDWLPGRRGPCLDVHLYPDARLGRSPFALANTKGRLRMTTAPLGRADVFCRRFGLRLPILLAPMAGVSPPSLSIAVANA